MTTPRWIVDKQLRGPRGPGKSILTGVADPGPFDGEDGEFYVNQTTLVMFGPKTAGEWGEGTELVPSDSRLVHKTDIGAYRAIEGEMILAGKVLDMAMVTPDDHLARGWDEGAEQFGLVVADYFVARDDGVIGAGPTTPIDLWLIAGQSNATPNLTFMVELCSDSPWIVRWNPTAEEFETEDHTPPWLGSGIARAWWERDASKAGRRVGIIDGAIGGTGFTKINVTVDGSTQSTSWKPTNPDGATVNLATRARNLALDALAAAPAGSVIKGIFWSQGEADRGQTANGDMSVLYGGFLDELIAWFRTELSDPVLPVIISPFAPQLRIQGGTVITDQILTQLEDTPRRIEYTSFDLNAVDDSAQGEYVHWTSDANHRRGAAQIIDPDPLRPSAYDCALLNAGRSVTVTTTFPDSNVITGGAGAFRATDVGAYITGPNVPAGTRILVFTSATSVTMSANATAAGTAAHNIGAGYRTPPGLKIARSGGTATITWGHPATRVTSFVLETNVNGAGWTTETLPSTLTHSFTKTVTAGQSLWARISAVTPSGTSYTSLEVKG